MDLEEVWRIREEEVYPALFGTASRGIFPLAPHMFEQAGARGADPRWMSHGVVEFEPTEARRSWLYVTSGASNPWWTEPEAYDPGADAGVEFMLLTTRQGDWAVAQLQRLLAFDLMLSAGHYPELKPLGVNDRVPLRAPIDGAASEIRNVVLSQPLTLPSAAQLPSGRATFLTFTGITDAELEFTKSNSVPMLIDRLAIAGAYPVTDPDRVSLV